MKLSIWQQFSSNHSSSYTVVGEFQSATKAKEAFDEVMKIMTENFNWYLENDAYPENGKELTPVEKHYGQQYGFDWKQPVDWARYNLAQSIKYYDRMVIIDTIGGMTWQTGHQFVNLLSAMDANVAQSVMEGISPEGEQDIWMSMHFRIECQVESEARAVELIEYFQQIFKNNNEYFRNKSTPWIVHHPTFSEMKYTAEMISQMGQDYADDANKMKKIRDENPKLTNPEHHEIWAKIRKIPHEESVWFGQLQKEVVFYSAMSVMTDGKKLIFSNVHPANIPIGLESFMSYLKQLGCTNIEYSVEQL